MPKYRITGPDGATYEVTAPEGATDADVLKYAQSQMAPPEKPQDSPSLPAIGPMVGAKGKQYTSPQERHASAMPEFLPEGVRSALGHVNALPEMFVRGATVGLSDYALAGVDQAVDGLKGLLTPEQKDKSFDESVQGVRGGVRKFQSANPVTGYGAEIAGSIYSPLLRTVAASAGRVRDGVGLLDRGTRYLSQGAATGAVAGAGYAQDSDGGAPGVDDLAFSTGVSAAIGAPLALGSGAAIEGGGAIFNWVRDRLASRVAPRVQGAFGGPTAPPVPQSPNGAFGGAPTPPPAPPQGPNQWRRPPQDAGDVAAKVAARAAERDGSSNARLGAKLGQLGDQGVLADTGPNMQTLAMTAAQQPGAAMQTVNTNLQSRGAGRETRLVDQVLGGVRQRYTNLVEGLQAQRSQDAAPLYDLAFAPNTGSVTTGSRQITSPAINRLLERPDVQKGLSRGIKILEDEAAVTGQPVNYADYALRRSPETGQFERVGTPTLRLLDAAKRGMDDLLFNGEGLRNQFGRLTQEGRGVERMRQTLVSEMDRLTLDPATGQSVYRAARNAWAGPSAQLEAAGNGRAWLSDDLDDVAQMVRRMGDSEREAYTIGMMRDIEERLQKNPNAALKLLNTTMAQRRMRMVLPKAEYNSFKRTVLQEAKMLQTERGALGGSQTSLRDAAKADVNGQISEAGDTALALARGRGGVGGIVDRVIDRANRPTEQVMNELARMLTSKNPAERQMALQRIQSAREQMALEQQQLRALANRGSTAPVSAGAPIIGSP